MAAGMAGSRVLSDFCSLEQQHNNTQEFVFEVQQRQFLNYSL